MDMIGSGKLSKENLPQDRVDILDGIRSQIQKFRKNAYEEEMECVRKCKDRVKDKERPNNVISILGGRGSGKTSVALTIHNEFKKESSNYKNIKDEKYLDFILDIIDPSKFNVEDNALGRIIYSFESYINELKKKESENDKYCMNKISNKLSGKYEKLKDNYIHSRKFYRDKLSAITESRYEYDKINQDIILADKNLEDSFRGFIEEFCCTNRDISAKNDILQDDTMLGNNEPLIFITFDDVDMCPEKGPEILDLILNYLSHPNIICIVLGDYSTFSESLVIDLWKKSNIPGQLDKDTIANNNNTLFDGIVRRADDILGKVLPYNYRFELKDFSLRDRLSFTPFGNEKMPKLYELLDSIYISKVEKGGKDSEEIIKIKTTLLKYFMEPLIDVTTINNEINNINLTRTYEGYESDVEESVEYNKLVLNYKEILSKIYAQLQENETNESKEFIELKNNKYNEFNNLDIFDYTYVLSGNPRGLINLYYKLREIISNNQELRVHDNTNFFGFKRRKDIYQHNYNVYSKLFEAFYNSNIDISSNSGIDIRLILKLNKDHSTLIVNKANLKLLGGKYYEYFNFNVSSNLLQLEFSNEKTLSNGKNKSIQLNNEKSAFIQLFYDLGKIFLGNKIIDDREDLNFENIRIYEREEDSISYTSINFKYFYDFYYFQRLYKLSLPLIIRDRKVSIDIRNRLKAISLSIVKCLSDEEGEDKDAKEQRKNCKLRFVEDVFIVPQFAYYKISDIKNKHNEINNIAKNYGLRNGLNSLLKSGNIVHEILNGQEQDFYNVNNVFNDMLEKSKYHLACNKILSLSDNLKKPIIQRCRDIIVIRDEAEKNDKISIGNLKEIFKYAENNDWNRIRTLLIKINEDIIKYLIEEINKLETTSNEKVKLIEFIKDGCQSFYNTINKNNQKELPIGLHEFVVLQEKIKESINNIITPLPEEETIRSVLKEFVSRNVLKETFKDKIIEELGLVNFVTEEYKESIVDIGRDNFKEKMIGLLECAIGKWYYHKSSNIDDLLEVATDPNKKIIQNLKDIIEDDMPF